MMIQVLKRHCCQTIFAACIEPYCYTDEDWTKDLKQYVKKGCGVQMVERGMGIRLEKCKCQGELNFNDINKDAKG